MSKNALHEAGLELMRRNGKPLQRIPGRAFRYKMPNGETVRVRTHKNRLLIGHADSPQDPARFSFQSENDNWLLFVTFDSSGADKKIVGYLIPLQEVADALNAEHKKWIAGNPDTKGANTTWTLYFGEYNDPKKSDNYARKWEEYRLDGDVSFATEKS